MECRPTIVPQPAIMRLAGWLAFFFSDQQQKKQQKTSISSRSLQAFRLTRR
jgi:hypothetical protein